MNFKRVFQLFAFILLGLCGSQRNVVSQTCETITPSHVKKVDVLIYINGDTTYDVATYNQYCYWKKHGMPFDKYAPVTFKVGGEVICNANNECNCPNYDSDKVDCTLTFQHVCAEQILGQEQFKHLLCCAGDLKNPNSLEIKGFKKCVNEQDGLAEKIADCMKTEGSDSPKSIALQHAQEVIDKGVNLQDKNTEPFFFYNEIFNKCISEASPTSLLEKICSMLQHDIAKSISQCVEVMGW